MSNIPALATGLTSAQDISFVGAELLRRHDCEGALELFNYCLEIQPEHTTSLALKAVALNELRKTDAARFLFDFEHLIQITRPSVPSGFSSLQLFHQALADAVASHHSLSERKFTPFPSGRSTGNLLHDQNAAIRALEEIVRLAIKAYCAKLAFGSPHPFSLPKIPNAMWLTIWGNILDSGEQLGSHFHPNSWLSGVYYPRVVDGGGIEFGRPPTDLNCSSTSFLSTIAPEEGSLLLFPSYFPHRTLNFIGAAQRITVAFELGLMVA